MTAQVVVVVPVLRRPHRVAPLMESLRATVDERDATLLFVTDPDDDAEIAEIDRLSGDRMDHAGSYAAKVNAAYRATSEPLIFLAADDVEFLPGWLDAAAARMERRGVGVVGTNDLSNPRVVAGRHATHSLVAREYADARGTIDRRREVLHEGYRHNFCDDELLGTARRRQAYAWARDSHVRHLHPNFHPAVVRDEVYEIGQAAFEADRAVYQRRRRLWR